MYSFSFQTFQKGNVHIFYVAKCVDHIAETLPYLSTAEVVSKQFACGTRYEWGIQNTIEYFCLVCSF